MRCPTHCPPASSGIASMIAIVAVAAVAAVPVLAVAGSVAVALIALEVVAAAVIGLALRYRLRRTAAVPPRPAARAAPQRALARGALAITDGRERAVSGIVLPPQTRRTAGSRTGARSQGTPGG